MLTQTIRWTLRPVANERGVALPMAMVMLVVLTALMVSFAVLAKSEPTIAANQMQTAQALRLADSGLQLAIWAMNNSTDTNGISLGSMTYGGSATGKYNGTTYNTVGGTGGFTVLVQWVNPTNSQYERTVTAVGWTPSKDNGTYANTHRKIQAIIQQGVITPLSLPCVVCVAGEMQVNGSSAGFDSSSNGCPGQTPPTTAIQTVQALQYNAHPTFTGYGTSGTAAIGTTTDTSAFKYSSTDLANFKAYAQAHGTYYQGAVSTLPTGTGPYVVYIDTTDGSTFSNSTPTGNDGSLSFSGNSTFNGTVIVAGSVTLTGTLTVNGLVYSMNDLSISGHVTINGGIVSENRRDSSSSNIDTDFSGNIQMNYNCGNIRNLPFSSSWMVKPGAYLETAGY